MSFFTFKSTVMKLGMSFLVAIVFSLQTIGQPTNPQTGSAAVNVPVTGSIGGWSNPTGVLLAPPPFAFSGDLSAADSYTDRLKVTGFGFAIPSIATITGIEVTVVRSNVNDELVPNVSAVVDNEVLLVKADVVQDGSTQNQANQVGGWPASPLTGSYGGPGSLWNNSWSVADINDPGFGMAISAKGLGTGVGPQVARVWFIRIRIFYTLPLPIVLKEFTVSKVGEGAVGINWVTSQEDNLREFEIQRSANGSDFRTIAKVTPKSPNSDVERSYSVTDSNPNDGYNYYRLKQTDLDDRFEIFPVRIIYMKNGQRTGFGIIQTSSGTLRLTAVNKKGNYDVLVRDINGRLLQQQKINFNGSNDAYLFLKSNVKGVVYVSVMNESESKSFRIFAQ